MRLGDEGDTQSPPRYPGVVKKIHLEYRGGGSSKFWEISVDGRQHTVRFGKIGTDGRSQTKSFKTPALAKSDAEALTRAKLNKGYSPAKTAASGAKAKPRASGAEAKQARKRGMGAIVDELITAMTAAFPDARPKRRKPATTQQIATLERSWKRPLPPSYRAFLEVTNGIAGDVAHRLVGTEDQKWAARQVDDITEYWERFDPKAMIPVAVPLAGDGTLNFAAFDATKKGAELPVVDWDTEREHARYKSFEAFLERQIESNLRIAKENAREAAPTRPAGSATAKAPPAGKPVPKSGPERAQAFKDVFRLNDFSAIERAIDLLVAAKPSPAEVDAYFEAAEDGIFDAKPRDRRVAYARASLVFHPELQGSKRFHETQLEFAFNQLEHVTKLDPQMASRWADTLRGRVAKNADLGRQLAEAYARAGRADDAIAVLEAALRAGYEDVPWNSIRTAENLSSLFGDPRFQKLVDSMKPAKKK
jgi:predicted DNA-binding WGR domain protein